MVLAVLLCLLGALAGCSPGTPDKDSWRVDAIRAVGDVSSAIETLQLALRHHADLFHPYLQTVAVDAERNASAAADKLTSRQPPDAYLQRADKVTSALDDADDLLTEARIAVLRRDTAAYGHLAGELSDTSDRLDRIEDSLRALPDDRSRP